MTKPLETDADGLCAKFANDFDKNREAINGQVSQRMYTRLHG
jgi:hypothetical protein